MAAVAQTHAPVTRREVPWAIRQGALAGVVAGLVFAAFEMIAGMMMMGAQGFWGPLRMIGAIVLGQEALDPSYSLAGAASAGVMVHMVLAVIYGVVFAVLAGGVRSRWGVIGLASAYGVVLWLVNFYVIAPVAFPWFANANPMVQFIAHAFFFGSVLGLYLWASHERLVRRLEQQP